MWRGGQRGPPRSQSCPSPAPPPRACRGCGGSGRGGAARRGRAGAAGGACGGTWSYTGKGAPPHTLHTTTVRKVISDIGEDENNVEALHTAI